MSIKEIINKERWKLLPHHLTRVKQHNAALDRIADAVLKRIAESPPVAGSETEPDFTGRVAELEAALKLAMIWLDDEVPKYIVDELINSLR